MTSDKQAVEISCGECGMRFRLWVPAAVLEGWEGGSEIRCVGCGARHIAKKTGEGVEVKTAAVEAAAAGPEETPAADAETVLLIDDDELALAMAESSMKGEDLKLVTARNAAEAFKVIDREKKIDLIAVDMYLKNPDDPASTMDGEEFLVKVKERGMKVPAVMTTGKDIIDDIILDPKWFDLNVKGFIQKGNPFWTEELKLKIKEVLYKD
ncbi:MAG TPA: response regulator [Deltaproteobacteria bacterium]|nr:response regulator [Deltaproteobacteria bacterium]